MQPGKNTEKSNVPFSLSHLLSECNGAEDTLTLNSCPETVFKASGLSSLFFFSSLLIMIYFKHSKKFREPYNKYSHTNPDFIKFDILPHTLQAF